MEIWLHGYLKISKFLSPDIKTFPLILLLLPMFYNEIHKTRGRSWIKETCHAWTYQVFPNRTYYIEILRSVSTRDLPSPPPLSLLLSLIRISLPRLDGCRVESRSMRWPAVFGIRTRVGPVCSRPFDEWLAWLLCLAWEYDPSILGRRSSRHWFMKYPILQTFDWKRRRSTYRHLSNLRPELGGGGTIRRFNCSIIRCASIVIRCRRWSSDR